MSPNSMEIRTRWRGLENWLKANASADLESLLPGASPVEISVLESGLSYPLDAELTEWFRIHNGVQGRRSSADPGAFIVNYSLLSTSQALEAQKFLASEAEEAIECGDPDSIVDLTAHARWVPFAQGFSGDMLFVDHREGPYYGSVGEIQFGDPNYELRWASLSIMLADIEEAARTAVSLKSFPYVPRLVDGRMLQWFTPR